MEVAVLANSKVYTCLQIQFDRIFTPSDENTSRVWNVDNAQLAFTLTGQSKYIVSLSAGRTVHVWCGQTGVQRHVLRGHTGFIECISGFLVNSGTTFSFDTATMSQQGQLDDPFLRIRDSKGKKIRLFTFQTHAVRVIHLTNTGPWKLRVQVNGPYRKMSGNPARTWIISPNTIHLKRGEKKKIRIFFDKRRPGKYFISFDRHAVVGRATTQHVTCMNIKKKRLHMQALERKRKLKEVASIKTGTFHRKVANKLQVVEGQETSHRRHSGCVSRWKIKTWDASSLKFLQDLKGHLQPITSLCFRLKSTQLFSSSKDRMVKLWDLKQMGLLDTMFGHQDAVLSIDCLNKERVLSCGGQDRSARLWKVDTESQQDRNNKQEPFWIVSVAALPFTDLVTSGSNNGELRF
ncbi:unnamed protein product, partial [Mesorhabditis belari]|uniref:Uncharacterized protein n=1 Tax=Mesorhabditis belari TaxID=2138241 RepID=A0AAF3F305_9BILA